MRWKDSKKELNDMEIQVQVCNRKQEDLHQTIVHLEDQGRNKATQIADANQQATLYKNFLDLASKEIAGLREGVSARDKQRKKSVSEVDILRSRLLDTETQMALLQSEQHKKEELEVKLSQMSNMILRLTAESEKSTQALPKAISSSIRLCVVAPTVNIHVTDKKMKFCTK